MMSLVTLQQRRCLCVAVQASGATAPANSRLGGTAKRSPYPPANVQLCTDAPDILYDAIIVGAGVGGLTTAARLTKLGAKVLVLEKYLLPGGSAAHYKREGYTFDVGSSMMFEENTNINLITKALEAVGKKLEVVTDPTQVHYHLPPQPFSPKGLSLRVWRDYERWLMELVAAFPHEEDGIRGFYAECWRVFNALKTLEFKSLEEPRYLMGEFFKHPLECLVLATYVGRNAGDIARQHITDEGLLSVIDAECFIFSTVRASLTPMVNAGMVFCDRHYGGINYPIGGVGRIAESLAEGVVEQGGRVMYKANVKEVLLNHNDPGSDDAESQTGSSGILRATGVRLSDGRVFRGRAVVSNATRWDTFGNLVPQQHVPAEEACFLSRYKKSPSFFSMHMGVHAHVLPDGTDVHHIVLDDWAQLEEARGVLFISIPTLLDPSLAPAGRHIIHAFVCDWIDNWQGLSPEQYEEEKERVADSLCARLELLWPGLRDAIEFREVGTPRTHRRYLSRNDGTYGPIPARRPLGVLSMPMNSTSVPGLYCVGDSTFPGQGVNAVVFSGFGAAHRVAVDIGLEPGWPLLDGAFKGLLAAIRNGS